MNNNKKAYVKFENGKLITSTGEELALQSNSTVLVEEFNKVVASPNASVAEKLKILRVTIDNNKKVFEAAEPTMTDADKEECYALLDYLERQYEVVKRARRLEADHDWSKGCKGFAKKTSAVAVNCAEVVVDVLVVVFDALLGLVVTLVTSVWDSLKKLFNTITNTFKFDSFKS